MPWAASPLNDFCHDQVATSSLSQGSRIANTAEVASQIASPLRSSAIQSPLGTRTPDVVPFQGKTTSRAGSTFDRSGSRPYGAFSTRTSGSFSCSTSATQPSPKFSQASMSTPRSPNSDHIAISIAPVSEPATMPTRQSAGMPRIARERSTTSASRASPTAERCERPLSAPASTAGDHPGRLAQGPDEKHGLPGRRFGFMGAFLYKLARRNLWAGPRRASIRAHPPSAHPPAQGVAKEGAARAKADVVGQDQQNVGRAGGSLDPFRE